MKKMVFDVVGALIEENGKILVCQRLANDRFGLLWEFPGGKVERGEEKTKALKRELKEELGIEVEAGELVNIFEDEIPTMKIIIYLYKCRISKGIPKCIECKDFKWLALDEIGSLNLAPADRKVHAYLSKNYNLGA